MGASTVEASKIAGHASIKITEEYTVVQLKRQEELTVRIQGKLEWAARRVGAVLTANRPVSEAPAGDVPSALVLTEKRVWLGELDLTGQLTKNLA